MVSVQFCEEHTRVVCLLKCQQLLSINTANSVQMFSVPPPSRLRVKMRI